MRSEKQYRYPGTRPFTEDESELFFGRNEDIENLSKLIRLEQFIVLFGKSGLGKSSLLNAGVLPLFKDEPENTAKKEKYIVLPVRIGLTDKENSPSEMFLGKIAQFINCENTLWAKIFGNYNNKWKDQNFDESFWLACKNLQIQNPGNTILLVFDQFEELFLFKENDTLRFAKLLSTVLYGEMPQGILEEVYRTLEREEVKFSPKEIDLILEKLKIKVVVSIRSDKMSLLNRLKTHIPYILVKTYELHALNFDQAEQALLNPANASGEFISPQFTYKESVKEKILNYLSSNKEKPIETFQLQLICQFCENLIIKRFTEDIKKGLRTNINEADLGNLASIFTHHYDRIIKDIKDEKERYAVRVLIEENLVVEGVRVPLPDITIKKMTGITEYLLKVLVDRRLLRREPNNVNGFSYEISHDSLVEPITKSYKIRFEQEEKEQRELERQNILNEKKRQKRIIWVIVILAIIFLVLGLLIFNLWRNSRNAFNELKNTQAAKLFEDGNRLKDAARYEEAIEKYNEANNLTPQLYIQDSILKCSERIPYKSNFYQILSEIDSLMLDNKYLLARDLCDSLQQINYDQNTVDLKLREISVRAGAYYFTMAKLFFYQAENNQLAKDYLNKALQFEPNKNEFLKLKRIIYQN